MSGKASEGRLEVKSSSRGKPQVYMRTTADSISSADTSARTIRKRSLELERVQVSVYGGAEGVHAHEVADLKRMSSAEQDKLLRDAQIKAADAQPRRSRPI